MQDDGVLDTSERALPSTPLSMKTWSMTYFEKVNLNQISIGVFVTTLPDNLTLPDNAGKYPTLQVQTCRGRGAKSGHKVRLEMGNGNLDSDCRKSFNLLDIAEMRVK
ncbi:hypothetical protein TNCV_1820151 [Trichonephila clavipes]|nr:hypothetical protein TNCV_1820151 [Trichonephila clavipes]